MRHLNDFLKQIPVLLSSKVSIFIYIFLFIYLVIFGLIGFVVPSLKILAPSQESQLILGNYTNVLSALGASIAAGSGAAIHSKFKKLHESHEKLQDTIDALHDKIDLLATAKKDKTA